MFAHSPGTIDEADHFTIKLNSFLTLQVYPYFFIPYPIPKECKTDQDIQKSVFKFGTSLNEAMNLAKPNAEKDQHIVAIVLA